MNKALFINSVKDGAIEGMTKYGILASLTIAQAICESGWGGSYLSTLGNNLFGIKAFGYPTVISLPTQEYVNGKYITITADFRSYKNWNESVSDHALFLTENSRYSNLIGVRDYKEACTLIQEDGYATDPKYTETLINIIEDNELYLFDINEEVEEMKDFTEEQKARQALFVVPDDNNVPPTGDNITLLNGFGWIETIKESGRLLTHMSRVTYYEITSDGHMLLTHLGETRYL